MKYPKSNDEIPDDEMEFAIALALIELAFAQVKFPKVDISG